MTPDPFHGLAELLPEPLLLIEPTGLILAANPAARTLANSRHPGRYQPRLARPTRSLSPTVESDRRVLSPAAATAQSPRPRAQPQKFVRAAAPARRWYFTCAENQAERASRE